MRRRVSMYRIGEKIQRIFSVDAAINVAEVNEHNYSTRNRVVLNGFYGAAAFPFAWGALAHDHTDRRAVFLEHPCQLVHPRDAKVLSAQEKYAAIDVLVHHHKFAHRAVRSPANINFAESDSIRPSYFGSRLLRVCQVLLVRRLVPASVRQGKERVEEVGSDARAISFADSSAIGSAPARSLARIKGYNLSARCLLTQLSPTYVLRTRASPPRASAPATRLILRNGDRRARIQFSPSWNAYPRRCLPRAAETRYRS